MNITIGKIITRIRFPALIKNGIIVLIFMQAGCPLLTTLETPEIDSKPEYPSPFAVGTNSQIDLGLTILQGPETLGNLEPIHIRSGVPLFEGKIKWILIDERLEFTLNGGTSGLGLSVKTQLIKKPFNFGLKFGLTGLPFIIRSFPTGCYTLDILAGKKLSAESSLFGGCKFVSWLDVPQPVSIYVDPYFDAVGGFLGMKLKGVTVELGVFRVFDQMGNYWGKNGYIPVLGISLPFNGD